MKNRGRGPAAARAGRAPHELAAANGKFAARQIHSDCMYPYLAPRISSIMDDWPAAHHDSSINQGHSTARVNPSEGRRLYAISTCLASAAASYVPRECSCCSSKESEANRSTEIRSGWPFGIHAVGNSAERRAVARGTRVLMIRSDSRVRARTHRPKSCKLTTESTYSC
jgi:hypothetical protein